MSNHMNIISVGYFCKKYVTVNHFDKAFYVYNIIILWIFKNRDSFYHSQAVLALERMTLTIRHLSKSA